jgi:hypothetical protein
MLVAEDQEDKLVQVDRIEDKIEERRLRSIKGEDLNCRYHFKLDLTHGARSCQAGVPASTSCRSISKQRLTALGPRNRGSLLMTTNRGLCSRNTDVHRQVR